MKKLKICFWNKIIKYKISLLKIIYLYSGRFLKTVNYKNKIILDLDLREKIDRQIYFRNHFEDNLIDTTIALIKKNKFDFFFDIGCNFGIYSLLVAKEIPGIKIYSFDIFKKNIFRLKQMINKNNLNNIITFSYGLSDQNIEMKAYTDSERSSVYRLDKLENRKYKIEKRVVLKKTDDEFSNLQNKNIFIKVDVENHEPFFLKGAKNLLTKNNCIIQIETNDEVVREINEILTNYNYKLINNFTSKWDRYYSNF